MIGFVLNDPFLLLVALYFSIKLLKKIIKKIFIILVFASFGFSFIVNVVSYIQTFINGFFTQ